MKWAGMYFAGFFILLCGVIAALWKMGVLASIGATWSIIGVVIAIGIGIMFSVANSGIKESIDIHRQ